MTPQKLTEVVHVCEHYLCNSTETYECTNEWVSPDDADYKRWLCERHANNEDFRLDNDWTLKR